MKNATVPIVTAIVSATSFCASNKHVIPMILSLELLTLSMIGFITIIETSNTVFILTTLILIVTEGLTGLTIMINSTKANGNDLTTNSII